MKKTLLFSILSFLTVFAFADKAPSGIWRTITLADGSQVEAELQGDEYVHFWQTRDGACFMEHNLDFVSTSSEEIAELTVQRRAKFASTPSVRRGPGSPTGANYKPILGKKKGLVILAEFTDMKFSMNDPNAYYNRMLNEVGYSNGLQKGSVRDYFHDQSNGQFELDFDVVGPIQAGQPYAYFGEDSDNENDIRVGEMIGKMITAAANEVNLSDYDWDGDGEVDQFFVLYAGKGQSTSGIANTIWPHMSRLRYRPYTGYKPIVLNGVTVDTYACSNEITNSAVSGIGVVCHEFSHCLGFPDMYDTTINQGSKKANYGMGTWDLMNSGDHNDGGYTPAGYTSWEKMVAGWITPIELSGDMVVRGMKPMSQHGNAYIVYNPGNKNEYYMLENRKKEGWDASLGGEGLLILHVDFDPFIFGSYNCPNTCTEGINDHQRLTIFHADGTETRSDESGDAYPYGNNNFLSNYSKPAAEVYNANTDGSKFMNIKISKIALDEKGDASFYFGDPAKADAGVLFAESFDDCTGTGANDGSWMTMKTGIGAFKPDNTGWEAAYIRGASYCARVGDKVSNASTTSPSVAVDGEAELCFRAVPFTKEGQMQVKVTVDNSAVTLSESAFQLTEKDWTDCKVKLNGKGNVKFTFTGDCRFYLDEVMVTSASGQSAVGSVRAEGSVAHKGVYNLQGQRVTNRGKGIYIINGKKVAF